MSAGPVGPVKSWLDRLLEFSITITAVALLLNWAWTLIKPLIPVVIIFMGVIILIGVILRRRDSGW
jgi:hypothetical protein